MPALQNTVQSMFFAALMSSIYITVLEQCLEIEGQQLLLDTVIC